MCALKCFAIRMIKYFIFSFRINKFWSCSTTSKKNQTKLIINYEARRATKTTTTTTKYSKNSHTTLIPRRYYTLNLLLFIILWFIILRFEKRKLVSFLWFGFFMVRWRLLFWLLLPLSSWPNVGRIDCVPSEQKYPLNQWLLNLFRPLLLNVYVS